MPEIREHLVHLSQIVPTCPGNTGIFPCDPGIERRAFRKRCSIWASAQDRTVRIILKIVWDSDDAIGIQGSH